MPPPPPRAGERTKGGESSRASRVPPEPATEGGASHGPPAVNLLPPRRALRSSRGRLGAPPEGDPVPRGSQRACRRADADPPRRGRPEEVRPRG